MASPRNQHCAIASAHFRSLLTKVFDVEIVGVKAAEKRDFFQSVRLEPTHVVVPDFPQLESERVNSTQCLPVAG